MVNLLFMHDDDLLTKPNTVRKMLDPTCGTGGMLSEARKYLREHNLGAKLYGKRTANPSCRFATGQLEVGATQRCGNNSSNREFGQVGNLVNTSLR